MFRKKKTTGAVTVFEDDNDGFDDLGLDTAASAAQEENDRDLQQLQAHELEALAIGTAQTGKESTARALRMAHEAREIGVNTATVMQQQTEQLEHMADEIEVVHDYLDKSERIIDKMSKPKIVRMFQRKKPAGKGLDKVRGSRKERTAKEEMREKGVEALDMDRLQSASTDQIVTLDDLDDSQQQRNELFGTETSEKGASSSRLRAPRFRKKDNPQPTVKSSRQVKEDYSQYSEPVANVMREQDEDLDQISDALADMKELAGAMNNELEYQDKLIHEVQDFTQETSRRTKENARKITKIK